MQNTASFAYWFLLACAFLALEMATGTFYLLVLGVALGVGGLAALLGLGLPLQIVLCAAAGVIGAILLRRQRIRPGAAGSQSLDVGQPVSDVAWRANGRARVRYRGAEWDAELAGELAGESEAAAAPREGTLYIKAVRGSTLLLTSRKP